MNFHAIKDTVALRSVSNIENLHFVNANIDTVTQSFSNQLEKCVWLNFTNGTVKTVLINSKLLMIDLNNTATEKVIIEQGQEYKLVTLLIRKSKLTRTPPNVNQLKQLKRIDIIESWIEYVSLNDFNGLDNLYEIDLSGNRIKQVQTSDLVSLPTLFRLGFHNNRLYQLDTCRWDMPSLAELRLNNNNLVHFSVGHFLSLKLLALASNPMNCAWMTSLVELLQRRAKYFWFGYKFTQDEWSCNGASLGGFDVHCASTPEKIQELDPDSRSRLEKIESAIHKLDSKLNEQYNMANDMIETMYRTAIARAFWGKRN